MPRVIEPPACNIFLFQPSHVAEIDSCCVVAEKKNITGKGKIRCFLRWGILLDALNILLADGPFYSSRPEFSYLELPERVAFGSKFSLLHCLIVRCFQQTELGSYAVTSVPSSNEEQFELLQ